MFWGRLHPTPPQLTHAHSPTRYDSRAVKFFMATKVGRVNILRRPATVGAGPPESKNVTSRFSNISYAFQAAINLRPRPHNLHTPTVPHGTTIEQSNFSWRLKLGGLTLTFYGDRPLLERGLLREKNVTSRFPNISYAFQAAINFLCNLLCMDVKLYSTTALRPPM